MEQITVKLDKSIYNKIKARFNGFSFNKALKMLLIQESIELPSTKDKEHDEILHYFNSRMKRFEESINNKFNDISG